MNWKWVAVCGLIGVLYWLSKPRRWINIEEELERLRQEHINSYCPPLHVDENARLTETMEVDLEVDLGNLKSACCQAPVYVEGGTVTQYYVCTDCWKPCDVTVIQEDNFVKHKKAVNKP